MLLARPRVRFAKEYVTSRSMYLQNISFNNRYDLDFRFSEFCSSVSFFFFSEFHLRASKFLLAYSERLSAWCIV
jgi:hypothetical protein